MTILTTAARARRSTLLTATVVGALAAATIATTATPATAAATATSAGHAPAAEAAYGTKGNARVPTPTVTKRATLSADYLAPGPRSGAKVTPANGRTGPFNGQVIPGFSAALANPDGTFWAQPDNGFGAKDNSADFRLRLYLIRPRWETARGGQGQIQILRYVELSDPWRKAGFPITNERGKRLLTGADFDIESVQRGKDGSFWVGEEFGPFVLHFDAKGRLLSAPVPFPYAASPQSPLLGGAKPNLPASGGFEAMAQSSNKRYLYPITEKALTDADDPRMRVIAEFDTKRGRYTGKSWDYRVDTDDNLVADAQVVGGNRLWVLERDNFDGDQAVTKKVYEVNLRRADVDGGLHKQVVVDLLKLANPHDIGAGDGWGTGDPFAFGHVSVETIVPLPGNRLLVANDNNYPADDSRRPGQPDDTELIEIDLGRKAAAPTTTGEVIAHRGASGYRPEHTLAAYSLAIRQCAATIEPDVVATKDGHLVARHENEISGTTNVGAKPEFADRKRTKTIDGTAMTGWFTEDFTLAELRTLRAIERLPDVRTANTAYDGLYPIPTLAEVLDLARSSKTCDGKQVGVAPELKHPTYFQSIGLALERPTVTALKRVGLNSAKAPVTLQSFEVANLRELNTLTPVRLAQNIDCSGAPYDFVAAGDKRTYADLVTPRGMRFVASYADVASFCKNVMIERTADGRLGRVTPAIRNAHRAGLTVVGWTFRAENQFLPTEFRRGPDPNAIGDMVGEVRRFRAAGMDGLFSDHPDLAVAAMSRR